MKGTDAGPFFDEKIQVVTLNYTESPILILLNTKRT